MRELQEFKRAWTDQDPDQNTDYNPLSLKIQAEIIPPTLRVPKEKFSGIIDPTDHVAAFESHMDLYGTTDTIKCRAFLATVKGVAQSWYDSLSAHSITKFKQFKKL